MTATSGSSETVQAASGETAGGLLPHSDDGAFEIAGLDNSK
jgi:hypothetical protein